MTISWNTSISLALLALIGAGCSPRLSSRFCTPADLALPSSYDQVKPQKQLKRDPCNNYQSYIPDTLHLDHTPIKYIRVNVHWVNSSDKLSNYDGEEAIKFTKGLMHAVNYDLAKNAKMLLPRRNTTPVIPTQYRMVLTGRPGEPADEGIYFHYDDEVCYYIHKGKNANLFDRRVIQRYGIQLDTVLNIFIMPHHPDSVVSSTYLPGGVGVALGSAVKMAGPYENPRLTYWDFRGVLNHEIGHIYSLSHTWAYNDGCDDTPLHPQDCFGPHDRPGCDTLVSNNFMDYAAVQNAWTPCQIGKIHQRMATANSKTRAFLQPNWCQLHEDRHIYVKDSVTWTGHKDLEGHLTIEPGAVLTIRCRVALPADAKITVKPGGKLVLDNCRLYNDCGDVWQGIEIQTLGKLSAKIEAVGQPVIEHALNTLQ